MLIDPMCKIRIRKRAKISNWIIKLATGTAMAAIACSGFIPREMEKAVAKIVPELASILMHHQMSLPLKNSQLHTSTND